MKNYSLSLQSENEIRTTIAKNNLFAHERAIVKEILAAIEKSDIQLLETFNQFGSSLRHIYMNVHAYRSGLEFGFAHIQLDEYGWLIRPNFLDIEKLVFGDKAHHGEHSTVTLGHGPNHRWTYGMHYCFGTAGGAWSLSVYDASYASRSEALAAGLADLKARFTAVLGSTDNTNHKQSVITRTLADIAAFQNAQVQLSLF